MAETFPTLSEGPKRMLDTLAYDPSMRSQAEDGVVISRRKFTGNKKKFELFYDNLTDTDKGLLESMQNTVGVGAGTINWTNEDPNDSAVYETRLEKQIEFNIKPSNYGLWAATIILIEV